jgi:GNAT superfamily N-acetyltransferase
VSDFVFDRTAHAEQPAGARPGKSVRIRPPAPLDSLPARTGFLHQAYAPLGAMGLNCTAVDQRVEGTRKRCAAVECLVLECEARAAGTAATARDPAQEAWAMQTPWLLRADTARLSRLAVAPALQRRGLGRRLVARRAATTGIPVSSSPTTSNGAAGAAAA